MTRDSCSIDELIDCTSALSEARDCLRCLWNNHYRHFHSTADIFDVVDAYQELHDRLIADFCGFRTSGSGKIVVKVLESVQPSNVSVRRVAEKSYGVWDPLESAEIYQSYPVAFESFFDFGVIELRSLKYIQALSGKLNEEGDPTELLIDFDFCQFFIPVSTDETE